MAFELRVLRRRLLAGRVPRRRKGALIRRDGAGTVGRGMQIGVFMLAAAAPVAAAGEAIAAAAGEAAEEEIGAGEEDEDAEEDAEDCGPSVWIEGDGVSVFFPRMDSDYRGLGWEKRGERKRLGGKGVRMMRTHLHMGLPMQLFHPVDAFAEALSTRSDRL